MKNFDSRAARDVALHEAELARRMSGIDVDATTITSTAESMTKDGVDHGLIARVILAIDAAARTPASSRKLGPLLHGIVPQGALR